ncbi:WcaI family glycosyltransferase [Ensifer soli]|uniref:WcaI family glycosyltransferase n=1 Tax=Ciceribacter sp. sgz301302 TaxID=3342379 RepID=UPI0035B70EE2
MTQLSPALWRAEAGTKAVRPARLLIYAMNHTPEIAGVGRYTGEIAAHFAAEGMEVTVVTTPPHYPAWTVSPGFANRYGSSVENGIRVLRCPLLLRRPMRGLRRLLAPLSFALTSAPVVVWQILRRRPAVVFCVEPTLLAAPVAALAAALVGARRVLHVQDLEVDAAFAVGHLAPAGALRRLAAAFERVTLRLFDRVVTISNRMASRLEAKGVARARLSVVRNWVDLSEIHPLAPAGTCRAELGFRDTDFVVLYSGTIGAKQGLDVLLKAAALLREDRDIHVVIAGEGPEKAALQARCGADVRLRFLPFQPQSRLNAFLNMADLHVLPQERGAADLVLPSKLGGMLATGKPVLVTADPGTELADFLGDAALITPPGDAERLAQAIRALRAEGPSSPEARRRKALLLGRAEGLGGLARAVAG